MKPRRLTLAVIIIIGLAYLKGAFDLGFVAYSSPGAGLFGALAAILTIVASAVALVDDLLHPADADEPIENWRRLLTYVAIIALWAFLFPDLGFVLSSGLAVFAIMKFAENDKLLRSLIVAVSSLLVSWLLFEKLLGVPLPPGLLFR